MVLWFHVHDDESGIRTPETAVSKFEPILRERFMGGTMFTHLIDSASPFPSHRPRIALIVLCPIVP